MTRDKMLLSGAWAVMAAAGCFSFYKINQTPKLQPWVLAEIPRTPQPPPPPVPHWNPAAYFGPVAEVRPAVPGADVFRSKGIGKPKMHDDADVYILPYPVLGNSKGDLDGVTIGWSTVNKEVPLQYWMKRHWAKATGFIVHRQQGDGSREKIAELPPTATSYTDLSVEPRQTYRYWVTIVGMESILALDPPILTPKSHQTETPSKEVLPSGVRVKLIGGDRTNAMLKIETYDRAKKYWVPKTRLVTPGAAVPDAGWTLKGLRFDDFTLVADLTDDAGVDRVLTTRE